MLPINYLLRFLKKYTTKIYVYVKFTLGFKPNRRNERKQFAALQLIASRLICNHETCNLMKLVPFPLFNVEIQRDNDTKGY